MLSSNCLDLDPPSSAWWGPSVHSPRLLHGVMHVARPSASVSSRSSVGAVSREPVQGVALFCPPAVARPSLRPPTVRVRRKDAAVVTVATQCLTTLSWAVWPRCPPAKTFFVFAGWIRVSLLSTSHSLCPTHLAATVSPVAACTSAQRSPSPPNSRRGLRRGSSKILGIALALRDTFSPRFRAVKWE